MIGLILGRYSFTTKGIFVQPGIIDSDYQGKIEIMLKASGYHIIFAQTCIAQLLLFPYVISKTQNTVRGEGGFSSRENQFFGQNQLNEINLLIKGQDLSWPHRYGSPPLCYLKSVLASGMASNRQQNDCNRC